MKKDRQLDLKTSGDGLDAVRESFAQVLENADELELAEEAKTANKESLENIMMNSGFNVELRRALNLCWNA